MVRAFVIAGHGAGDPGACAGGCTEADLVRRLAARMKALGGADVQIGDTSRNWYADNGIGRGHCPKGVPVIELHMDSAAPSARGGHVVIGAGIGGADAMDRALASFVGSFMPGRARAIVERADLANANRAAAMGVNYRLIECGFISNDGDRSKFIDRMDELARGILAALGITAAGAAGEEDEVTDQDIEKIAQRVWGVQQGRETHDRCYRMTSMLKAMCGIGAEDTTDPKDIAGEVYKRTIDRWARCTAMLKAMCGIPKGSVSIGDVPEEIDLALSDENVERIAERVAELLGER